MKIHDYQNTQINMDMKSKNFDFEGNTFKASKKLEIQEWIVLYVAELLEINHSEIDIKAPLERYGIDSAEGIGMIGNLEDWLGHNIEPTLLYNCQSIEALAKALANNLVEKSD